MALGALPLRDTWERGRESSAGQLYQPAMRHCLAHASRCGVRPSGCDAQHFSDSVEATRWCLEQPGAISCRPTGFHSVPSRGEFTIPLKIGVPLLCCGWLYLKIGPRKLVTIAQFSVCNLP